jgi:hypothetical protein
MNSGESACCKMKSQAIEDLKAGIYKLYEFGIVSSPDTNTTILKQLNIELVYGGCVIMHGIDCYRAIMDSAIRAKYRDEIIECPAEGFERIRFKDEFYNMTDSILLRQNTKRISCVLHSLNDLTEGKACIQILINKKGKPIKIKWLKGIDKKNDLIIIEKLMKVNFESLTIGNKKVNTILTIPIKVN